MQRLGLSDADFRAYNRGITVTHERRIHIEILTLDGDLVATLTPDALDGQVLIDATVGKDTPTRILDFSFLDPSRSIQFEPDTPGGASMHRKFMIRIIDSRRIPELGDWVDCEVFTGPLWDFDREGAVVKIVAHGLERQAMGQKWKPVTYKKRTKKTDAIKDLLAAAGEPHLGGIPDMDARMPERMTITRMDTIWPRVLRLSESLDRQTFYPGHGRPIMRRLPSRPVFTFDDRHLLSEVLLDRNPDGVFNTFVMVGSKPKGAKVRPQATESLPPSHPNSAQELERTNTWLRLVKREENRQVKTIAEAKARAKRMEEEGAKFVVNYGFDSLPIPHLDENDMVRVRCDEGTLLVRMKTWSLPLGFDGAPPMSVGTLRRTTRVQGGRRVGFGKVG